MLSVIGMAKNVGKTTVLNYLVSKLTDYRLILTSIGRDGEDTDIVTNTKKPRIYVPDGSVIITAEGLLGLSDITVEVLATTGYGTPMGKVVVVRALSAGFVQLGGPSMVSQLEELLLGVGSDGAVLPRRLADCCFAFAAADSKVIIDGAISRKSLASPRLSDAAILCTGASLSPNENVVVAETKHAVDILTLPAVSDADTIYVSGVVSDRKLMDLLTSGTAKAGMQIVADDPSKIFISAATFGRLIARKVDLRVRDPINLVAVTVNPVSPRGMTLDSALFLEKMQAAVDVPVFDVVKHPF